MLFITRFSIINGDKRNERLNELLAEKGFESKLFEAAEAEQAAKWGRVIVLPIKGVDQTIFNGHINAGQCLITGQDFLCRQDFAILNVIPTVEGALQIAMENTNKTIHSSKVLIIGYGRIGKLLAKTCDSLGANVSVSARKDEDFAWIKTNGYETLNTNQLLGKLHDVEIIFNTVPHLTLGYTHLSELKKDCVIIDLASMPGGVDFKAAENLGLSVQWALSLPGKVAPESAAQYMMQTLLKILQERGVNI